SIISVSGIMNGTSNYILTMMQNEGLEFKEALKLAQENGYAEADPTLDVNGGDAAHKLILLTKLAFGMDLTMDELKFKGIESIDKDDIAFADEIDCNIKQICYAKRTNGKLYATVQPMMVKRSNMLAEVNDAINAVRVNNKYSGKHVLVGKGAGSSETASSIVADIVFIARYSEIKTSSLPSVKYDFMDADHFEFPYIVTFDTIDEPGITGLVATSIGTQNINIDTVSHNKHERDHARFSVLTKPCRLKQIKDAIKEIKNSNKEVLIQEPKIIPVLY
ncbi:MAG: homoserine dehydrogenase, partial [Bacteroidales bacterium]|nr:homoserine dehydrogenase [Bacteroidales bacterium]